MDESRKSAESDHGTNRIERSIEIRAPLARVWRALADAEEFGAWFGVALAGQTFVAGRSVQGLITHPGYEHLVFNAEVERVEPERRLAFRWHPYAIDPAVDYSAKRRRWSSSSSSPPPKARACASSNRASTPCRRRAGAMPSA